MKWVGSWELVGERYGSTLAGVKYCRDWLEGKANYRLALEAVALESVETAN